MEDLVSQVTLTESSASSLIKMTPTMLYPALGTIMWKFGILGSHHQSDQFMDRISVVTPLTSTMDFCLQAHTKTVNNCNCGTLEPASLLKTSLGTMVCPQINHALFMAPSSKRIRVILLLLEVVEAMKSRSLTEKTCSSHAHRLETYLEHASQLTSATVATCLQLEEEME